MNRPVTATVKRCWQVMAGAWNTEVSITGSNLRVLVRTPYEIAGARIKVEGAGVLWTFVPPEVTA